MSIRSFAAFCLLSFPLVAGCAPGETETDDTLDVRVEVPAADDLHIDFVSGETVIEPGEEKMTCTHFRYDGPDTAFDLLETMQGKFGHHAVLLGAKNPLEPGTVEDCSELGDMNKYDAYTIGDQELPPGHGVFLPAGKAMVLQAHYVNTGEVPIRTQDVVRVRKMAIEDVQEWAAIYITNHLGFSLPPGQKTTVEFDCTVQKDVKLLLVGGHMHENGTAVELRYGADEVSLETMFRTDPWDAEFRDNPPMQLYFENPLPLTKGTLLRTRCDFSNTTPEEIKFPQEMCVSFGYAAGSKEPSVCNVEN